MEMMFDYIKCGKFFLLSLYVLLITGLGIAEDLPFVFEGNISITKDPVNYYLGNNATTSPNLPNISSLTSSIKNDGLELYAEKIRKIFNQRIEPNNPEVINKARIIAANYSGDRTIDQICAIYDYLKKGDGKKKGWSYESDPLARDFYSFANESMKTGETAGCVGVGDCDDFAILMSSLIESIGGRTRIIFGYNKSNYESGHAYAEVYIGVLNDKNNEIMDIIDWLKQKYKVNEIFTDLNSTTQEYWLNLDWFENHPGGPFYPADERIIIYMGYNYPNSFLTVPDKYLKEKAQVIYYKGKVLFKENKSIEAIKLFDEAIDVYPRYAEAFLDKGTALQAIGHYDDAIQCYEKAINIFPLYAEAWFQKGNALFLLKKYDQAIQCYDEARNATPHWSSPLAMKGRALMAIGREKDAGAYIDMAASEALGSEFLV